MRAARPDLIPVLAILMGGAFSVVTSVGVLSFHSASPDAVVVASSEVETALPPPLVSAQTPVDPAARPSPTYTVAPGVLNIGEVRRAMFASFPREVRDGEVGGTSTISFLIDERGEVRTTRLEATSGYDAVDQAAMTVAQVFRFSPALSGATPVTTWFSRDITFDVR